MNLEGLQCWIAETGQTLRLDLQLAIIVVLSRGASYCDRVTCWSQDISQSAVAHAVLVVYLGYFFVLVDVVEGIGKASSLLHRTTFVNLYLRQQAFMFLANQSVMTTYSLLSTTLVIVNRLIVHKSPMVRHG